MIRYTLWATVGVLIGCVILLGHNSAVFAESAALNHVQVQTIPGQTVSEKVIQTVSHSWPWYLVRASGIVAAVSLVILILSGIGHITGHTYAFLEPLTAWATHRALGIIFALSVIVHMGGLLFDQFVPFTILELLVPWMSGYKPVTIAGVHLGSLYIVFGIVAFYMTMAIVVSSLLIINKKPRSWKALHLLSYMTMVFVFVHALYIGTDIAKGWVRIVWIGALIFVVVAALYRSKRAFSA